MKANSLRNRLVHAAKSSATIEEVCHKLGKKSDNAEKIWGKLISKAPGSEDFLLKNECQRLMTEQKLENDLEGLKETREEYMRAFTRLQDNGFIYKPSKEECLDMFKISDKDLVLEEKVDV